MSHRRPQQVPAGLDSLLRSALFRAVDSVEPAADGLDRIRAKIVAGRHTPQAGWRLAAASYLESLWRLLGPVGHWLRQAAGAVATRFRPEPGRADWLGWLRPAAALATGLFVVASASWAIAALPSVIAPSGNPRQVQTGGGGSGGGVGGDSSSSRSGAGSSTYSSGPGGQVVSPADSSSASCKATSPGPSGSGSATPSGSPTPTPSGSSGSGSPSTSPSPSQSSSGSPSTSPSPTDSPTTDGTTQSPASSQTAQAVLTSRSSGHGRSGQAKGSKPAASQASGSAQTSPAPPLTRPSSQPCH